MQGLVDSVTHSLSFMPKELIILIISMLPILELRGGVVAAALLKVGIGKALLLCIIGNIIPIPFILFFITPIFKWLKGTKRFKPMVDKLEAKSLAKGEQIKKYEFWGLVLFVGIPLPGTGAWTGALLASLLGIDIKKASKAIFLGLLLSSLIMVIISYGIPYLLKTI